MAPDSGRREIEEFAAWLRGLRLEAGQPSLRDLSRLTGQHGGREVPRSTLAGALAGERLPSYDTAMAIVRTLAGSESIAEGHRRWRGALAAQRGETLPGEQAPRDDAPAAGPGGSGPLDDVPAVSTGFKLRRWMIAAAVAVVVGVAAIVLVPLIGRGSAPAHRSAAAGDPASAGEAGSGPAASPLQLHVSQASPCMPMYYPNLTEQQLDADVAASQAGGGTKPLPHPVDTGQAGIPADQTQITITVQSAESESVILTGMSVLVRDRKAPPAAGAFVSSGACGDHLDIREFRTDLGHQRPAVTPDEGNPNFPFSVSRTDPEVLLLHAFDRLDHCTFDVRLEWTSQGHAGSTLFDNNGKHYEVTGVGHRPAYDGGDNPRTFMTPDPNPART